MKRLLLIPAALIALQAQADAPLKLPITQANHAAWMQIRTRMEAGHPILASLSIDLKDHGRIVAPKGSAIMGRTAQDGSSSTFTKVVTKKGREFPIEPFTLNGPLFEGH